MEYKEIADFTAGINRFVEPTFLQPNESRILKNGTISTGALINENGHDEVSQEGGFFMFNTLDFTGNNKWFFHEKPIVWYELTKRIYKSALGRNLPITAESENGTDLGTLGVVKPTLEPSLKEVTGGVFYKDEVYNYVFTFVKGKTAESQPSKHAQATITADGAGIEITIPTPIPNGVTEINIYRQGGGTSSYMFVDSTPISTLTYTDTFPADDLMSNIDSLHNEPPPKGMILDTEFKSMLVGHIENDNVLRFSKEIFVDAWSSLETISLDSKIIRAIEFNGQLIVLCSTAIYRIAGTNIDNFSVDRIPTEQGCLHYESVVESRGLLFWQSEDGISAFDGANITVISTNKLPKKELTRRDLCAVARDEELFFADTDGIIAVDVARGLTFRDYDGIGANIRGMFYIHKEDQTYASDGMKTYALFRNPNDRLTIQYKSGAITMGSLITLKQFRKLMIFGEGRFDFQLKIDGTVVITDYEVNLDGVNPTEVLVPMGESGRRIEVLLQGNPIQPYDVQKISNILIGYDNLGVGK